MKFLHAMALLGAAPFLLANVLDAKPRTCRVVFPERPRDSPKMAYLFDGTASWTTSLPSMNLAPVIELPNGELIIAMTPEKISDPKTLSPEAPRLKIPEGVTDFYILVTPAPENRYFPVKMNLVDTGGGKLKPGETLWFNGTGHRIVAKLGNARMSVDPMARSISRDPVQNSGYYAAEFTYQPDGKGQFAPITEQHWWHDAASRHLGFIVNTGGKLPKIYFFRDFRDPVSAGTTRE